MPLFRLLSQANHQAPDRIRCFIGDAQREDAGEASAQLYPGLSPGEIAAEFLGEGEWAPQSSRW